MRNATVITAFSLELSVIPLFQPGPDSWETGKQEQGCVRLQDQSCLQSGQGRAAGEC